MARIAGIKTQKNTRGEVTHVTIDVKKHQEVMPMLKELGVISKSKFQIECESAITRKQLIERSDKFIESLPWKK